MTVFSEMLNAGWLAIDIVFGLTVGFLSAVIWKWPNQS